MADSWRGQRVTVMGLGMRGGGVGVARYLAEAGATVTVTDLRSEDDLRDSLAALSDLPIRFVLGRHDEHDFTFAGADVVVRNPGVRRDSRYLEVARESGVRVEMEMSIFLRACPAPVIGVTGTKGKTTTATLCAEMLRHWRSDTVLAGNMGVSALAQLGNVTPETPVVLELSSWQLEALDEHRLAPEIAVLTNVSEDHLDAYDSFEDYAATKRSIALHQRTDDAFVINLDDEHAARDIGTVAARVVPFAHGARPAAGVWVEDDALYCRIGDEWDVVGLPDRLSYLGLHQQLNAAAAAAAALLRGAPISAVEQGLESFRGVFNRMEVVAEIDGVTFINDTAATAPVATISNLQSFAGRPVHLIAGGHDKQSDLASLAKAIVSSVQTVRLLEGTASPALAALIERFGGRVDAIHDSMAAAVEAAASAARPGEIVILSPGCASFGLFRDEFDRGDRFRAAVASLRAEEAAV